ASVAVGPPRQDSSRPRRPRPAVVQPRQCAAGPPSEILRGRRPGGAAMSGRAPTAPPELPKSGPLPLGVLHVSEPLGRVMIRLALAGVEPALELDDWTVILACSRRKVEELKSAGKLPPVDFYVG